MPRSLYVTFPEARKIDVREETIAPPEPGEILCQSATSLISIGTETYCLRGDFDPGTNWAGWVKFPFRPGYSTAARVVGVGKDVTGVREGDRVFVWSPHQQYLKITPDRVHPIPAGVSDEEATWGCLAVTTQLAVRRAELQLGERVAVVGLGMLGQLIAQYLLVAGARQVICIDRVQGRLDMARAHGATHVLHMDVQSARAPVEEISQGRMLDAVWDVTGHPAALSPCVQLLRKLGRVVLVGDTPNPTQQSVGPGVLSNSIAILGVHGAISAPAYSEFTPWTRAEMTALFYDYVLQGRMRVRDLITHRFSPAEAPAVYTSVVADRSRYMGIIFDWSRV
mgnify:CR=1 FL=1